MSYSGEYSPQQYSLKCFFPVLHILHIELYRRHHPQNTPATPLTLLLPNARMHPLKKRKSPSHPTHVVTFRVLACRGPLSLFSRPLWPQPPRFTSLCRVIDLPCETHATVLLSFSPTSLPFIPIPPPSSSYLSLDPHLPPPLHPTQRMTSHPLYGLTEGSFI